jgi:hypothetical protein
MKGASNMNFTDVLPRVGIPDVDRNFSHLSMSAKSQLLRDKIKLLRQSTRASQETLHQIETHLTAISQEPNLMKQWNHYELAYEGFIAAGTAEDLLSVMLSLRTRTHILDPESQEIWSKNKLDDLEQDVRKGTITGTVREEIAALARAVYECGFRFVRESDLKSRITRTVLSLNVAFSILVIGLLWFFQLKHVEPASAWQIALIGCLGASGAILRATVQMRKSQPSPDDLPIEPLAILFRGAFGAILAIVVTLFLQLRVVDFPYLHIGAADSTPFAPAALYVFAFASGLAEQVVFGAIERTARKQGNVKVQDYTVARHNHQP